MATSLAQDAAVQERIIKHMNNDHQDSIQRFLESHENAGFYEVRNARMTDIDLSFIAIEYSGKKAVIPLNPPMKSLSEARERLVKLDKEALETLERSDIRITTFLPPWTHASHMALWTICITTFLVFSRADNLAPGSPLYDYVLARVPTFAEFCQNIQAWLFCIMVAIHTYETRLMVRKLRKHGVNPTQGVWWKWVATCFVEGFTSFDRLNVLIDEKTKEKEAKKH